MRTEQMLTSYSVVRSWLGHVKLKFTTVCIGHCTGHCLSPEYFLPFLLQSSSVSGTTGFGAAEGGRGKKMPCPVESGTWLVLYCGGNANIEQV